MNHAAARHFLSQKSPHLGTLNSFSYPFPRGSTPSSAPSRRSDGQVEELVRLDPRREPARLSRERLSNGLSLRFAYSWLRKATRPASGWGRRPSDRCIERGRWYYRETAFARTLARSVRADNARRTITPIEPMGLS